MAGCFLTLNISCFWAYWGAYENFHEGWYARSLLANLQMFIFQYLIFTIIFIALGLISIKWSKIGLVLHCLLAVISVFFFAGANKILLFMLIALPLVVMGLLYYYGEIKHKKRAYLIIIVLPLIIVSAISIQQGIKVSQRLYDNDTNIKVIKSTNSVLAWAPRGVGWPKQTVSWQEATEICKYLAEDGTTVMDEPQNIWRLPTLQEAVSSMMLHGENAGGVLNSETNTATYLKIPDKESPLWDIYSPIIYYWTSNTSKDNSKKAYIIVYNGKIQARKKTSKQDYLGFRAVKDIAQ